MRGKSALPADRLYGLSLLFVDGPAFAIEYQVRCQFLGLLSGEYAIFYQLFSGTPTSFQLSFVR